MSEHDSREAGTPDSLVTALSETGAIGSTVRQLADRLNDTLPRISRDLATLQEEGTVLRIGRGLWILRDYERLDERADFVDPAAYEERFQRENGVSLGIYRGPITFTSNDLRPVHRWWPYVQGYSADFVRSIITTAELPVRSTILDPFAGSGTTLVEARLLGHRALGCELLPPAALAARVKTHFELDPKLLERSAASLLRRFRRIPPGPLPFLRETTRHFSPTVLLELTRLRDALDPGGTPVADALRVAFGRILIPSSRLHRSPCLGYGREPSTDAPPPTDRFRDSVREMIDDLSWLRGQSDQWGPAADVVSTDARRLKLPRESIDLAVTSPPYVNGMDYVNNYKLDLAWLGYATGYADLARLRGELVACDNLPRAEANHFLSIGSAPDPWLQGILQEIRSNVARKATYRRNDVHGIVNRYFLDLLPVLRRVHDALRPGGRFVVVVGDSLLAGTYVPGDLILARMGESVGFRILSVGVARKRHSGQRRSFLLRETVVTLERPGHRRARAR